MADVIRLLPDVVANQIAAGEVIQRPSSVVKELMENSVDAGADAIEVWVTDAGKTNIQVVDNGRGMSETDARLSFERHATSKIRTAADLFALHTMGFRGEALASIVAVAQVELKTRTKEDDLGVWMYLEASKLVEQKAVACKIGSSFSIKNLFFNVPARRRFLKSDATELNNIMTEFERVALIHPEIGFTFHRDESLVMDLRPSSFRKRITSLFGNSLDKQLLPVQVETSLIKIDGFVGNPESARTKGARQFFFVNHRYMKHQYFNRAVMAAFDKLIPSDKQVPYFLCLEVDPGKIDVNIHPTKTEIKFEDVAMRFMDDLLKRPKFNNNTYNTMTKEKYDMIRENTYLDGYTFNWIYRSLENSLNLDTFTAKQIAAVMEVCYQQYTDGYFQCAEDNDITN